MVRVDRSARAEDQPRELLVDRADQAVQRVPAGHRCQRVEVVAEKPGGLVVPLRISGLSFFSITSVLGTPLDVTLSELAIESFLPADAATSAALHRG